MLLYYYWTTLRKDICWYEFSDVITLYKEPIPVARRACESSQQYQIKKAIWDEVLKSIENFMPKYNTFD